MKMPEKIANMDLSDSYLSADKLEYTITDCYISNFAFFVYLNNMPTITLVNCVFGDEVLFDCGYTSTDVTDLYEFSVKELSKIKIINGRFASNINIELYVYSNHNTGIRLNYKEVFNIK